MVITRYDVAESSESLIEATHFDVFREAVPDVSQLEVVGGVGEEEALAVAGDGSADYAGAVYGGFYDGDVRAELGLEDAVEVLAGAHCYQTVGVG